MPKDDYSEDRNIQEPAAQQFEDELEWRNVFAYRETFGPASPLGRDDRTQVVLLRELDKALRKLNPTLPKTPHGQAALLAARKQLTDENTAKSLLAHNQEKWKMMRNGITIKANNGNSTEDVHVKVIDFDHPEENDFLVVRELWIKHGSDTKRCDIIGFVNGLPLVFIELKRHDKPLQAAFEENYKDYRDTITPLFYYNALVIVSNGIDARYGSITAIWDHFYRWKRLQESDPDPAPKHDQPPLRPLLPILLNGLCHKAALLDLIANFTLFDASEANIVKVIARNHQMLGVNLAIAKLKSGDEESAKGKLGVFWHTQGSGKSYSMVFFCQKVHRTVSAKYTFVLLTDRKELDTQLHTTFVGCGISINKDDRATGSAGLEAMLKDQNRRYVFSLIHKFGKPVKTAWNQRDDVIVLSDEAHRTQHGRLATQMRMALSHAKFLAFTGTPLMAGAERNMTEQVFGRYVSVYDFQRAVADGATLPLSYDSRGKKLMLDKPELKRMIEERIDAARADGELTEEQEQKLYRDLARDYPILTSDAHLDDVATDLVEHFSGRWLIMATPASAGQPRRYDGKGKALLVCIDKVTCAKMAIRIRERWQEKIAQLQGNLAEKEVLFRAKNKPFTQDMLDRAAQINWMQLTQIHPVFSNEQNEVREFAAHGIDRDQFRKTIAKGIDGSSLEKCFKDSNHPFRVAIVCAMWLTGFDVKSLATLYLDKPMKGHNLMQAIARVNRVAPHKKNGLIVDYNGMLKSLRNALSSYGQAGTGTGEGDVLAMEQAAQFDENLSLQEYADAIARVQAHLLSVGFALATLVDAAAGAATNQALLDAQCALCKTDAGKKTFLVLAEDVSDRYRGLFPNKELFKHEPAERAINAIYNLLQKPRPPVDISAIMQDIRGIIDVLVDTVPQATLKQEAATFDLSGIDFERLRVEFAKSNYKETAVRTLQERIAARLAQMLQVNPNRIDLYQRYQEIILEYNRDKDRVEIERVFEDLFTLHGALDVEQQRYVREGLRSERELAVFDLLLKDKAELSKADIDKIKKFAMTLMDNINHRQTQMARLKDKAALQAQLKMLILNPMLEDLSHVFSHDEIRLRADALFQHIGSTVQSSGLH